MNGSENSVESEKTAHQMLKEAMANMEKMRLEMNEMQLAMAKVQKGPEPPVTPTPPPGHTPEYPSHSPSTSFPNHHYYQGRDTYDPQAPPPNQNPPPPNVPIFVAPPPATLQRSSSEPLFQVHDTQYFPPEPTFKAPEPYTYTPQFGIPEKAEKPVKNTEHEEVI
ncbi:leucine-rich repeat extensin-like protein 3 [Nicotiana sylvestris]|uniref:leucine-rich repeat extensin-like protein 3 n=1 Tax=Nicotiana sylvestris TaxID=4096 RepID=UPI00388CBD8E